MVLRSIPNVFSPTAEYPRFVDVPLANELAKRDLSRTSEDHPGAVKGELLDGGQQSRRWPGGAWLSGNCGGAISATPAWTPYPKFEPADLLHVHNGPGPYGGRLEPVKRWPYRGDGCEDQSFSPRYYHEKSPYRSRGLVLGHFVFTS